MHKNYTYISLIQVDAAASNVMSLLYANYKVSNLKAQLRLSP
jgi:hypothetical protein